MEDLSVCDDEALFRQLRERFKQALIMEEQEGVQITEQYERYLANFKTQIAIMRELQRRGYNRDFHISETLMQTVLDELKKPHAQT